MNKFDTYRGKVNELHALQQKVQANRKKWLDALRDGQISLSQLLKAASTEKGQYLTKITLYALIDALHPDMKNKRIKALIKEIIYENYKTESEKKPPKEKPEHLYTIAWLLHKQAYTRRIPIFATVLAYRTKGIKLSTRYPYNV
jgi:hypothetical protein